MLVISNIEFSVKYKEKKQKKKKHDLVFWNCITVGRHGGLMVSALDSGVSGPVGALAGDIVLQDNLLSQCLSPPRCINGYRRPYSEGDPVMD